MFRYTLLLVSLLVAVPAVGDSPYAGMESRSIKALSPQEVSDLLEGKGMGYALAAELNGYPGPLHVLELAGELQLTSEQEELTRELFHQMQERAAAIGRELVEAEKKLDQEFSAGAITPESLQSLVSRIARLEGELRQVHLETHLRQTELLSREQVVAYARLRGYEVDSGHSADHTHGHQGH